MTIVILVHRRGPASCIIPTTGAARPPAGAAPVPAYVTNGAVPLESVLEHLVIRDDELQVRFRHAQLRLEIGLRLQRIL